MLNMGCILVYLKYYALNLMPLMIYPKVLKRVDIYRYILNMRTLPAWHREQRVSRSAQHTSKKMEVAEIFFVSVW